VISEAIELARAYSGEDAAKFVNGVLDGVYRKLKDEGRIAD
jgi:transcription termination factor NusB